MLCERMVLNLSICDVCSGSQQERFFLPSVHKKFEMLFFQSAFVSKRRSYAVNDDEWPLTFLTIYDAPYELSDDAIIHRLSPYCEVVWSRHGTFKAHGGVYNGLRHYRVCAHCAILSFLRFGKFQIRMYYDGQTPSCRKCNRTRHKAAECKNTVCFNCDGLGHVSKECVRPMYCCIYKSGQHLVRTCPLSWHRKRAEGSPEQQSEDQGASSNHDVPAEQTASASGDGAVVAEGAARVVGADVDPVLSDNEDPVNLSEDLHLSADDSNVDVEVVSVDDVNATGEASFLDDSLADFTPPPPSTPAPSELDESDAEASRNFGSFWYR